MLTHEEKVVGLLTEIRDLLSRALPVAEARPTDRKRHSQVGARHTVPQEASTVETLLASRSDAEQWNVVWDGRSALNRWLAVLAIAEDEVGEGTALTGPEIARVVAKRFRVNGALPNNVTRDLRKARQLVNCRPRGKSSEFFLTRRGLDVIRKLSGDAGVEAHK